MSAKRQSKVLCQRAVPYELYKGLTFTTIWLEVNPRKKMLEGLCLCRAFLNLAAFVGYLTDKEKSKSTIESYTRYVKKFLKYVDGNEITKELVIQYRELLEREGSAYSTINLILISINCYFLILEFDLKTTD